MGYPLKKDRKRIKKDRKMYTSQLQNILNSYQQPIAQAQVQALTAEEWQLVAETEEGKDLIVQNQNGLMELLFKFIKNTPDGAVFDLKIQTRGREIHNKTMQSLLKSRKTDDKTSDLEKQLKIEQDKNIQIQKEMQEIKELLKSNKKGDK
jgi:hypothetical protein